MIGNKCEYYVSEDMTIINGCPVSQKVWHAKEPSLAISADAGSKCAALHRRRWRFIWVKNDKPQTNKQKMIELSPHGRQRIPYEMGRGTLESLPRRIEEKEQHWWIEPVLGCSKSRIWLPKQIKKLQYLIIKN